MSKISINTSFRTEGCEVSSVDYTISKEAIQRIKKAIKLLDKNSDIKSLIIPVNGIDVDQYDGELDEDERTLLEYGSTFHFRTDVEELIIQRGNYVWYRAWNKWDSSYYYEFQIDID
jgi:hypothetical protein